ncbi:MAG TPA: DUF4160 domain-containing protein [Rhizomicrobium sp.]|jgi:hypothetical protein|nr:DUF4160 domain-containing protein [Rhizomicrobium sp.]
MPTVLRIGGLRVVIWPTDHRPAHVHVKGAVGEAVFNLHRPGGPPALRESYGFKLADLNRIEDALVAAIAALCAEWR